MRILITALITVLMVATIAGAEPPAPPPGRGFISGRVIMDK